jgi:hyaluronan synthase
MSVSERQKNAAQPPAYKPGALSPLAPVAMPQSAANDRNVGEDMGTGTERRDLWAWALYATIFIGLGLVYYYNIIGIGRHITTLIREHQSLNLILYPSVLWLLMGMVLIFFRTVVWMFYRPFPSANFKTAPSLTVVIPAYNEGAMVLTSIRSVVEANYPRDRLEILVIDDGSKDDTWKYVSQAAADYPGLVTALRHERNRGKRAALALGFERARGEILVTLDSDSAIERDALLAIAGPFRDPRIGAVAGKVLVYNRRGIIPRMLHVRFVLSFDLLRSVESAYGNVFCCPGALSGLRASAVHRVLDAWKHQRFLGRECTFGEDRALTNFLFEAGYDSVYQRSAVVRTVVPEGYAKLCKMFIRWDRSYVREEIRFARIVWKRPLATRLIALYDRCVTNLRYPIQYSALIMFVDLVAHQPHVLGRMLAGTALVSLVNMAYFLRSERSLEFLYGMLYTYFYLFTLFWIFPYALCTLRARSWLTR